MLQNSNDTDRFYGFLMPHPPVLLPEVGRGREKLAKKTIAACTAVGEEIAALSPHTIVLISPHAPLFSDYLYLYDGEVLSGSFADFGAPTVTFTFSADSILRSSLVDTLIAEGIPCGDLGKESPPILELARKLDHGALVPLSFICKAGFSGKLVVLSSPDMNIETLLHIGKCIREAAQNSLGKTVLIASGDLSHRVNAESPYGMVNAGAEFDTALCQAIDRSSVIDILSIDRSMREAAGECGYRALVMLLGAMGTELESKVLSYEAPFGIGYAVASFSSVYTDSGPKETSLPVKIARYTLEKWIIEGLIPESLETMRSSVPEELARLVFDSAAGVFVSLKKHGELRGCIGTIAATCPTIAREIMRNAIAAGTEDPRFPAVQRDELPLLTYSVDILGPTEEVSSAEDLNPKLYGVIVSYGYRRGLLLPDLEGVDTATQQLSIACRKAGIDPFSPYKIERFRVTRYT